MPTGDADAAPAFTDVGEDWGELVPAGEQIIYGSVQANDAITHHLILRFRDDLTARHIVEHDGQRYRVKRIKHLRGARRFTLVMLELWGDVDAVKHFAPDDPTGFWG